MTHTKDALWFAGGLAKPTDRSRGGCFGRHGGGEGQRCWCRSHNPQGHADERNPTDLSHLQHKRKRSIPFLPSLGWTCFAIFYYWKSGDFFLLLITIASDRNSIALQDTSKLKSQQLSQQRHAGQKESHSHRTSSCKTLHSLNLS